MYFFVDSWTYKLFSVHGNNALLCHNFVSLIELKDVRLQHIAEIATYSELTLHFLQIHNTLFYGEL